MIKKLQRKFIIITMSSLLLVMLLIVISINGINVYQMFKNINGTLQILCDNEGHFPSMKKMDFPENPDNLEKPENPAELDNNMNYGFKMNEETPFRTRYFTVTVDEDGTAVSYNIDHIKAVSADDATSYGESIFRTEKETGFVGIYKYKIVKQSDSSEYLIIFLDCGEQIDNAETLLLITLIVSVGTLLLVFIMVSVFSKKAIKPIIESTEKQKQFITDAGHEIKTPIAIISANADVLELMHGSNEWITSVRNQTTRLDKLVKNMLMLSKMDEGNIQLVFGTFDISKTVTETAGSFATMADMQNKEFIMDINPGLKLHGDESSIQQLISTLADNAIKYSNDGGMIKISLSQAKKGIKLEVYNTTDSIDTNNLDKLFDRFYRSDSSRSRETGGYGIGLSIAKSIVDAHHGKITVNSTDGKSIRFTVIL
jgi:signal transduction histidine kinase